MKREKTEFPIHIQTYKLEQSEKEIFEFRLSTIR